DERKRSEYSCQAGHIDKENLSDGQSHDRCRRKPRRLRSQEEAGKEQKHSKNKPDRRVGILLGVARRAPRQNWPVVKRSYLESEVHEGETHGDCRRDHAIGERSAASG